MTTSHRQSLLTLLARTSFEFGKFKLSSGATSDYYIDCRTTTLHAEGGRLTGLAILDLLHDHKLKAAAVGGLTMGADPIVSNVASASAWHAQQAPRSAPHPRLPRPQSREDPRHRPPHRRLLRKGAQVVIVDDVCTTGASTITAIEAARKPA